MCLLGSSYLSTVGLTYINYPTKVVFRSCKLIPTMFVALLINKEIFSPSEVASAVAVCAGLVLFAFADMVRPAIPPPPLSRTGVHEQGGGFPLSLRSAAPTQAALGAA